MIESRKTIPCRVDTLGVLIPDCTSPMVCAVLERCTSDDGVTGRLLVGERVIAFLTYDFFDKIITGYTCTDLSPTSHVTETSIRNILNTL